MKEFLRKPVWVRKTVGIVCILALTLFSGQQSYAQFVTIGGGTVNTNGTGSDPIDGYFNSNHYQVVYTAAELTAAGLYPNAPLTGMGWSISEDYAGGVLGNYTVRLAHTSATNCATHNAAALTQVVNPFAYNPVATAAGAYDMIAFNTNFVWNGTDNLLVDICTGTANSYTSPYGGVRAITMTNGSRFARRDGGINMCGTGTDASSGGLSYGANGNKPEVRFAYVLPAIDMQPSALIFPSTTPGCFAGAQTVTFRVRNSGSSLIDFSVNPVTVNASVTGPNAQAFAPVVLTTGTLAPGATQDVVITTTYSMNAAGTYGFSATTSVAGDGNAVNNTLPAVNVSKIYGVTAGSTQSLLCPSASLGLTATGTPYAVTLLSENFNSGVPVGWTSANTGTGGTPANASWTLRTSPYAIGGSWLTSISSNDNSVFYFTDGDAPGSGSTTNTALMTPSFSTVGYSSLNLSFYHFYRDIADNGDNGYVDVSIDGGVTWSNVQTYTTTQGTVNGFVQANLNLNAFINNPSVMVRFRYSCTWDWGWAIDNLAITGGSANYTYSWASVPSGFTSAVQNPSLGAPNVNTVYEVTATSGNGCVVTNSVSVNVYAPPAIGSSISDVSCSGNDGAVNLTLTGGTPSFGYLWSNGAVTEDISGVAAGTYTVSITDGNTCVNTSTHTVGIQPGLLDISSVIVTDVTCNSGSNGAVDITTTGGTGTITYVWSNSPVTQDISNVPAGSYSVTATDGIGCTVTAQATVNEPTAILLSSTITNASCNLGSNGAIDLSASGGTPGLGYVYLWSNGPSSQDITGLTAGSYSVTVTDANLCTMTHSASVTEPGAIILSTTVTDVSCNTFADGDIDLTTSGGTGTFTYAWSNGPITQDISGLTAGSYSVTVTDANLCTGTLSISVGQPAVLTSSISMVDHVSCFGGADASAMVTVAGGTTGYNYAWSSGGLNASENNLTAGTYTVTITDANGCGTSSTVTITQPALLTAIINTSTDVSCLGSTNGSATVSTGWGTPGYTYQWSPAGGTGAVASNLAPGSYTVNVTDANGCTASDHVVINEPTGIVISSNVVIEVNGNDGVIDAEASGGTPGYTYSWSNGASTEDIADLAAGTYTLTVTDANGCTQTAEIVVGTNVGIGETGTSSSFVFFPNPSTGIVNIRSKGMNAGTVMMEIMDMSGRVVYTKTASNVTDGYTDQADLGNVADGTYLIRITSDKNITTSRIIVSK